MLVDDRPNYPMTIAVRLNFLGPLELDRLIAAAVAVRPAHPMLAARIVHPDAKLRARVQWITAGAARSSSTARYHSSPWPAQNRSHDLRGLAGLADFRPSRRPSHALVSSRLLRRAWTVSLPGRFTDGLSSPGFPFRRSHFRSRRLDCHNSRSCATASPTTCGASQPTFVRSPNCWQHAQHRSPVIARLNRVGTRWHFSVEESDRIISSARAAQVKAERPAAPTSVRNTVPWNAEHAPDLGGAVRVSVPIDLRSGPGGNSQQLRRNGVSRPARRAADRLAAFADRGNGTGSSLGHRPCDSACVDGGGRLSGGVAAILARGCATTAVFQQSGTALQRLATDRCRRHFENRRRNIGNGGNGSTAAEMTRASFCAQTYAHA